VGERDPFDLSGVVIDGKYRVASVVGDGGFGVVYRGVHKGFGELIAIKCLKLATELDEAARAELLEKLQEEGRLLHRLSKATSGIVQALDVGAFTTVAGKWVPYLVLEWLEGETLGQFLKNRIDADEKPLDLVEAMRLLEPAAKALAVAHSQKIAHRDVKPANIFLTDVGGKRTAKVLDFGIAKVLSDHRGYTTALEATAQAPTAFTPRYGAPEQFNKQRGATGPWTDVFALALVLVECVSGRKALDGDDPTQLYIASADPAIRPTLRPRGIEVSDEVEAVLKKALEVEPKHRYPDAGTFWMALEAAANIQGGETVPLLSRASRGDVDEDDPLLSTSDFAEKRRISVDGKPLSKSGREGLGPTMPVESMRAKRDRDSKASAGTRVSGKRSRDPMEETPEGERSSLATGGDDDSRAPTSTSESRSSVGTVITILAASVFAGGAFFAYTTFTESTRPIASSSASVSTKTSATAPPTSARTTAPTPSETPSAETSASAITSASAAPSASASAGPNDPGPEVMVKIHAATFAMGDDATETTVDKDFWLDRTEVTVEKYRACVRARKCSRAEITAGLDPSDAGIWNSKCNETRGALDNPMNCVTATQAEAFCTWKNARLPTDAEWELAARGERGRKYVWGGGDPNCSMACFGRNEQCPDAGHAVISCAVQQFSDDRTDDLVYDLAGNVAEWTSSGGDDRVVRGGDFYTNADGLRGTSRRTFAASASHPRIGFRCAANVE